MKREVRICSGWPADQKLGTIDAETKRASLEGWTIFYLEDGKTRRATLCEEWCDLVEYARRWMHGDTIEETIKD